ncbi:MAG: PASTA domain-containing protein [Chloracidobacterium sp.]|nr:PASTA domain-containing protein [Chloracidobacterium sp.]
MSIIKSGFSVLGRLAAMGLLAVAFLFGLATVVYMSLQGSEVQVPEITGKVFSDSERELAALGLKIKKRADRNSPEAINTVIEQLPKPGETVKTGQMILVVTSKGEGENGDKNTLKKLPEEDDSEKIEEMIDDKPKKSKSNSNSSRKKADTTRDVTGNNTDTNSNSNSDSNSQSSNSNKKETGSNNNSSEKSNKNAQTPDKKGQPTSGPKPSGEIRPKPQRP